jgi:hypothetical protein
MKDIFLGNASDLNTFDALCLKSGRILPVSNPVVAVVVISQYSEIKCSMELGKVKIKLYYFLIIKQ